MKKFCELLWRKEIPQIMGITFLFMVLATSFAVLFGPFQLPEEMRSAHYARTSAWFDWLFILIPSITVSVVVGIIMSVVSFVRQRRVLHG